ncbi:MAG: hypothetical protein ACON4R_13900 [Akkermansiaceae bacterium]
MSDPTPDPLSENPTLPEPIVPPTLPEPIVPLRGTSYSEIFEGLLKAPKSLIAAFSENKEGTPFLKKLIVLAALGFLVFGVTIGSFSYHEQLWAAPLKTLIGIIFSSLICLPSLYIFAALTGTPLKLKDIVQGMAGALALIGALLLGFTPVLWVFSQSTNSEGFFGFLILSVWIIALFFGTGFILKMLTQAGSGDKMPLRIWIGIFLLVTLQMSTSLRPLIGRSDSLFTSEKLFFLEHWGDSFTANTERRTPVKDEYSEDEAGKRGL